MYNSLAAIPVVGQFLYNEYKCVQIVAEKRMDLHMSTYALADHMLWPTICFGRPYALVGHTPKTKAETNTHIK